MTIGEAEQNGASWPVDDTSAAELVDRVVAAGVVDSVADARVINDGMQHLVLVLDDRLVARFPRGSAAAVSLQREVQLLSKLAATVTAPIPEPFHVDAALAVYPMLQGAMTTRTSLAALPTAYRDRLIDEVALFLTELSAASTDGVAPSEATTSHARFRGLRERADRLVRPLLWEHQRRWYDEVFRRIEQISFEHSPVIIHGDLAPYHVLHDPDSGAVTGILDFGLAGVGDAAVDLACLMSSWGDGVASELTSRSGMSGDVVERARLVAAALPLEWSTDALEHNAPDLAVAHLGHHVAPLI